ncbi:MAG: hypothetical protein L6R37_000174 [Teloschistes peruensis]|nr:MAG: hypothetical protein L6R37_000174 [Teloschistes peruensis]
MQSSSPDDPVKSHERNSAPAPPTKVDQISNVCGEIPDLEALAQLATSRDGLVNDQVRQRAWPILLGYDPSQNPEIERDAAWKNLPLHKDEDQVARDVDRSFIYYPKTTSCTVNANADQSESQLDRRKADLSTVITQVLRTYPMLSYFQGFHDIVQVFLLVLGADDAPDAVSHLALSRIRDFMLPSLSPSLTHLRLLPAILQAEDARLCEHLSQTQPFFALASTLTLYAHDIEDYSDIARLFDFLLAQDAIVSVYFFAEIILSRREELFEISSDDSDMLHFVLSKLPKPLDLETLIERTMSLYMDNPPETLPYRAWARISPYSVLKTARADFRQQTLSDGIDLFQRQVIQLRNDEMREQAKAMLWKYRRPAGQVGLAIVVGVLAIWLRKKWL